MTMNKARKKFTIYAVLSIFVLLTVLLTILNAVDFTRASEDADHLTASIAANHGSLKHNEKQNPIFNNGEMRFGNNNRMGPLGPDSPEMTSSLRYFTFAFDKDGKAQTIEFRMSAVSEQDAEQWAKSLLNETTGWTNSTYRFRVYEDDGKTFVTVIDQGRELIACYRLLNCSVVGEIIVLLISFLLLMFFSKLFFKPIEEADRKQKQFISKLEAEFKMPLTVINANTEALERESGSTEITKAINRQVRKMTKLVKELGTLSVFEEGDVSVSPVALSNLLKVLLDNKQSRFAEKGLTLETEIDDNVVFSGDEEAFKKAISELISNSLHYGLTRAYFSLKQQNGRITLIQMNDTTLQSGSCDQVFDRFIRLENADNIEGAGLGLSYVKDIVTAHNGRVSARVNNGSFTLRIDL